MSRMKCLRLELSERAGVGSSFCRVFGASLLVLALTDSGRAQVLEVTDNFNDGRDTTPPPRWAHYDPGTTGGQLYSWSFPDVGPGDKAYRIVGPPLNCVGDINRGGSYRTEQYSELFESVDLLNFDPNPYLNFMILGSRVTTPGAGQTSGY